MSEDREQAAAVEEMFRLNLTPLVYGLGPANEALVQPMGTGEWAPPTEHQIAMARECIRVYARLLGTVARWLEAAEARETVQTDDSPAG